MCLWGREKEEGESDHFIHTYTVFKATVNLLIIKHPKFISELLTCIPFAWKWPSFQVTKIFRLVVSYQKVVCSVSYFVFCRVIFFTMQTLHGLRKNHGFQACEGVCCLALLSVPNHHLLCSHGALGAVHAQHHLSNHCRYGGLHCLRLYPHPHPPGLGIFLQNMWLRQLNF